MSEGLPAPILRDSRQHDLFALTAERLVYDDAVEMTLASLHPDLTPAE